MPKWLVISVPAIILLCLSETKAYPHGEAADEPFLKDLTVAFYNVHVSPTSIKVGDPVDRKSTRLNSSHRL